MQLSPSEVVAIVERYVRRHVYDPQDREDARQDLLLAYLVECGTNPWDPARGSPHQHLGWICRKGRRDRSRRKRVETVPADEGAEASIDPTQFAELVIHVRATVPEQWRDDTLLAVEALADGLRPIEVRVAYGWTERHWRTVKEHLAISLRGLLDERTK